MEVQNLHHLLQLLHRQLQAASLLEPSFIISVQLLQHALTLTYTHPVHQHLLSGLIPVQFHRTGQFLLNPFPVGLLPLVRRRAVCVRQQIIQVRFVVAFIKMHQTETPFRFCRTSRIASTLEDRR
ncbi:Oxysterol-binding protein-related protein 2 [Bienertia sinuspersici]